MNVLMPMQQGGFEEATRKVGELLRLAQARSDAAALP